MFKIKNKLFIVTGATGYLGKAICEELAKNSGNIAICSTIKDKAQEFANTLNLKYDTNCIGYELDIANEESIEIVIKSILNDFQRVDCLVNNAFFTGECDFNNFSLPAFDKGIKGTVRHVALITDKLKKELENSKGSIINIASMYGIVSADPRIYKNRKVSFLDYAIGKSSIIHYTKYAAVQLAKNNIRVNAISPGPFPNDDTKKDIEFIERLENKIPLGRVGSSKEIAGSVLFLSSDYASYITGHNLIVDGGWTIW